jgi:NOL1/NOP2/sun family putative RNA methylase
MNLPEDFTKKMQDMLGDEWPHFLECYEKDRYQALRLNPLKKGLTEEKRASLLRGFCAEEQVPWEPNGYYYGEPSDDSPQPGAGADAAPRPGKHAYHEAGCYYIQEPSAMSAAALLAPQPGMRVLDLCAAPGGKTTQLASYLKQMGLLVANEIHPARCKILSQNVERMGIANAIVTNEDSGKLAEHFPSFFHAILVDAPCSGEGMFRKNPQAMEEWSTAQVLVCADRQREILENAAVMLLPGGTLCYSTCTFSREENEETIDWFLTHHPEFSVKEVDAPWFEKDSRQKTFRLWPHKLHGEGHFAAVLQKAGTLPELPRMEECCCRRESQEPDMQTCDREQQKYASQVECEKMHEPDAQYGIRKQQKPGSQITGRKSGRADRLESGKKNQKSSVKKDNANSLGLDRAKRQILEDFVRETLSDEQCSWILNGNLTLFGDQLYRLPDGAPSLKGIRVLRAGLHVGEFKKNRFEPSHALALYLGTGDVNCYLSLPAEDARIAGFLRGESIFLSEGDRLNGENVPNEHGAAPGMQRNDSDGGNNLTRINVPSKGGAAHAMGRNTTSAEKGWCLVCVDGCSLGWGKLAGNQIKNHYPKGLRKDII